MQQTGAQIVLECLLEQRVTTVFGYPGGSVLPLYDTLYAYRDQITHILTAHEQAAAHAADGYARASGKTGVCIATSGPGATNLVTGIATAYMDSIPLVAITGNVPVALLGSDGFQEVDILGVTMPITKHNFIVKEVSKLADTLRRAFYIANEGRKGPVLVDIPKDVFLASCDYQPTPPRPFEREVCLSSPAQIEAVIEALKQSKRPLLYAGGGVISADATDILAQFAARLDAPVTSSLMGQGGFDNTDPRYLGMLGMHGSKVSSLAISHCDLLLGIGIRFSDRVIGDIHSFAPHATLIHLDIDPAELNKNIAVDHELLGDLSYLLALLMEGVLQQDHAEWMTQMHTWKQLHPMTMRGSTPSELLPSDILETIDRLTDYEGVFTTEVGQHQMWAAQFLKIRKPRHFITSGGLGTMGFGLGAAMGASLALGRTPVINIAGDGCFQMNCNELSTVSKYRIPILQLLFCNNTLGMVRQWQTLFYDKRYAQTTLDFVVDYGKLAEAYDCFYGVIDHPDQMESVLQQALASARPALVECRISPDLFVLPMVPAGGSIQNPILEIPDN